MAAFARLAKGKGKGRSGGRAAPEKGRGKGTSKGKSKDTHELNSCDTGTLRYRADVPLNARRGREWTSALTAQIWWRGTI